MSLESLLARLPGLEHLLLRLAGLPPQLGEINLATLRDTSGLAELARVADDPAKLINLLEESHARPDRTLAAFGAAELLQRTGLHFSGATQADCQAELGRLLVLTGEVDAGLTLLCSTVHEQGPGSLAAWYLVHALRFLNDLSRRRQLLDALMQPAIDLLPDTLRCACQIEEWWVVLLASDAASPGIRFQLEGFLQRSVPDGPRGEQAILRASALHCLAHALSLQTSTVLLETSVFHLRAAIALYRSADLPGLAHALDTLGRVLTRLGEHEEATHAFLESLELKQQLRDLWGIGATFQGLAQQRLAQGRPLLAADLLQSNLVLLPLLDAPGTLIKQNQSMLVIALLTAAFPLEEKPAAALPRLSTACLEFAESPCSEGDQGRAWFYNAARRWLEARQIPDPGLRRARLLPALRLLRESLSRCSASLASDERSRIALFLALALIDRASLAVGAEAATFLEQAREHLDQADHGLHDLLLRPYLEWGFAQWAGAARRFDDRQAHLASARHYAELIGNVLFQGVVDDALNAHLSSPLLECPSPVVLTPGQTLEIPLCLSDWRQRRLPRFALRVRSLQENVPFEIENEHPRTDESGNTRVVIRVASEQVGKGELEIRTRAGRPLATVTLEACDLEIDGWQASPEDALILRQLFGSGYQRLLVRRVFEGGLSGMQVLLVHPQMRATTGTVGVWNGQPCIVKLGAVAPLASEWDRYQRWVRDLLPANVTRMTRFVAWEQRAGILMGLVGTSWSRSRSEHDWLLDASPFDAHYLLEQIFHRDLGLSWYSNTGGDSPATPPLQAYAWAIPPVWSLEDSDPPGGLLADPAHEDLTRLDPRSGLVSALEQEPDEIALDDLQMGEVRAVAGGWHYEMIASSGLRVDFRSPMRFDTTTGINPREGGRLWSVRGHAVGRLSDRLRQNLSACCAVWRETHPNAVGPSYDPVKGQLLVPVGGEVRELRDPLIALAELSSGEWAWHGSVIHGDLHGRNVLVDTQGQPYYIDFAKTRFGPTLYDFIKHELYLWHDLLARRVDMPLGTLLAWMLPLLERLRDVAHPLHRHPVQVAAGSFPDWIPAFEQSLQTLRVLGRAYARDEDGRDFHVPFAALAGLMLRWCPAGRAEPEQRVMLARQGLIQAVLAAWTPEDG